MIREKIKDGIIILLIIGIISSIWILAGNDKVKSDTEKIDASSLGLITDFEAYLDSLGEDFDLSDAKNVLAIQVVGLKKQYSDGNSVDYISQQLLDEIASMDANNTTEMKESLKTKLEEIRENADNHLNADKRIEPSRVVRIKSSSVCNSYGENSSYCLNGDSTYLNGYLYINDIEKSKWAVVLHGNLASGTSIFADIGKDWYDRGYNVIAPDLRGFGASSGDPAFGYLDSLDVYDWIKYINENYNVSSVSVHGVSLGAAVTLQLATNPDFSSDIRSKYHVNSFVDDSGYTSFMELVRGLLLSGNTSTLTAILEDGDISTSDFKSDMASVLKELGINVDESFLDDLFNGNVSYREFDNKISESSASQYENSKRVLYRYLEGSCSTLEECNNSLDNIQYRNEQAENLLTDEVLKATILRNTNFGLTSENFDKYQDSISNGRNFDVTDKLLIIHSQADTVVDPANSANVQIKAQSNNTVTNYYWKVANEPHAFILLGLEKNNYQRLVNRFIDCVENNSKCSAVKVS